MHLPIDYSDTSNAMILQGYFFRKSRIRIFVENGGILVLTFVNFGEKGVTFDVQCFTMKRWGHLG